MKDQYRILEQNLLDTHMQASASAEKSFAHLHEIAQFIIKEIRQGTGETDILRAVFHSDEASYIYRRYSTDQSIESAFASINHEEERYFSRQTSRFWRFYLCKSIAHGGEGHSFSDLNALIFGASTETSPLTDRKIAFLRNRQAFRAFEIFAKTLGGVSVLYENNFQSACEAVAAEQAAYAIIPIFSTSDGRLNSFYRMIEKYELNIIHTCDVDSDDGESMTTFALVYKERICLAEGMPKFECKITFDDLSFVSDIADAAYYYGAKVDSFEPLPMMFSGRAGTFSVVFDLANADIDGLLCYLALEYPQMFVAGIYRKAEKT